MAKYRMNDSIAVPGRKIDRFNMEYKRLRHYSVKHRQSAIKRVDELRFRYPGSKFYVRKHPFDEGRWTIEVIC